MAGFVKFAYGILMPAATAAGELACRVQQRDRTRRAEPRDEIVDDRQRHLVEVQEVRLQVRALRSVVIDLDRHAATHFALHRDRPGVVGGRAHRRVAVPVVDVAVVRERRIDLRRQRIRRKPLIEHERRRHARVGVREGVLADEAREVARARDDRDTAVRAADAAANRRLVVER